MAKYRRKTMRHKDKHLPGRRVCAFGVGAICFEKAYVWKGYAMQPYKPSGTVPLTWMVWLVMVVVGAVVWGVLVSIISQFVYLVILFPVGMGAVTGIMLSSTIQRSKMRNPMVAGLCGVLVALAIYSSLHYTDYHLFRGELRTIVSQKVSNPDLVDPAIDRLIVAETGLPGFWGYLAWTAGEGISIGHLVGGSLFTLNGPLAVLYWLVELGTIVYVTAFTASETAKRPFSERRNEWYPVKGRLLGSIVDHQAGEFLRLVKVRDFAGIGEMIQDDVPLPNISLYLQGFDSSSEDSILSACRVFPKGSNEILEGMISPSQVSDLRRGMALREVNPLAV